ncbi:MAG: response regulator [Gammaproteobacteria bacterium]|nr:response regulator [Gammaproteobacteria bacterium]
MTPIKVSQAILIVEDNNEDYEATKRAFRKAGLRNSLYRCEDGDEALDYLHRRGKYAAAETSPRPGIILLDLNLPGTDGREVLRGIKSDKRLLTIPVIVLTTSDDELDIQKCYEEGANSYMHKPVDLEGFFSAIRRMKDYWFEVVILPKKEEELAA